MMIEYKKTKGDAELRVIVDAGTENPQKVFKAIEAFVESCLSGEALTKISADTDQISLPLETKVVEEQKSEVGEGVVSEEKAPVKKRGRPAKSAEESVEEKAVEEAPVQEKKPVPEKSAQAKPETAIKPSKPAKTVIYDRNLDTHKQLIATFMDSAMPGWRKAETIKKAKAASEVLHGQEPMLDAHGEILESFKAKFIDMVK